MILSIDIMVYRMYIRLDTTEPKRKKNCLKKFNNDMRIIVISEDVVMSSTSYECFGGRCMNAYPLFKRRRAEGKKSNYKRNESDNR